MASTISQVRAASIKVKSLPRMTPKLTAYSAPLIALTAALALQLTPQPAAAKQIEPLKVGNWKGGAYSNNNTGRFSHCAASAKYKSGITLLFSVTRDRKWSMGFSKKSWSLQKGKRFPVKFKVDEGEILSGTAIARTDILAQVFLPANGAAFRQFRNGRLLQVAAAKDILKFKLTDADRMLTALVNCAKQHRQFESSGNSSNSSNPFSSSPNNNSNAPDTSRSGPNAASRREATTASTMMLDKADVEFNIIGKDQNPKLYAKHDFLWRMGDITGSMRIVNARSDAIKARVLSSDAKSCKGSFASGAQGRDTSSSGVDVLFTACKKPNGSGWNAYYAVLERRQGGHYLMSLFGRDDNAAILRTIGTRLTRAAASLNKAGSVPGAN